MTGAGSGRGERGSALLIVFVFAAMIAIMLYREMPVAAFEARRQKEELLIDRGNEYKHAIKLYVRKMQQFPPTLEALENTNRMRFLRHKFEDPITGKNDWRLLHAGPNGIILDSKIANANGAPGGNPAAAPGSASAAGASAFGSTATPSTPANRPNGSFGDGSSGFGSFGNGFNTSNSDSGGNGTPTLRAIPQRPPALAAAGGTGVPVGDADPTQPADPGAEPGVESGVPVQTEHIPAGPPNPQLAGNSTDPESQMRGLLSNQNPLPNQTTNAQNGATRPGATGSFGSNSPGSFGSNSASFGPNPPGSFGASSFGANAATGAGGTGSSQPAGSSFGGSFGQGSLGKITAGGTAIAGVASIAVGKTIKTVNDQTNFSLWEFYYDMANEAKTAAAGALGGNPQQPAGGLSSGPTAPTATSGNNGFGSSFGSSFGGKSGNGFGGSSFGGGGFGSNNGFSSGSNPATPTQPPSTGSTTQNPNQPQNQPPF